MQRNRHLCLFQCPLHLTLESHFSSALDIKGTAGELGATPWPNKSCLVCWQKDPREDSRVPCRAQPVLVKVLGTWRLTSLASSPWKPEEQTFPASHCAHSVHVLAQPPHLWWARDYLQAQRDVQNGSGLIYDCKIRGGKKTLPPEVVGWIPVLAHVHPCCCHLTSQHHMQQVASPHTLPNCHIFFPSKIL